VKLFDAIVAKAPRGLAVLAGMGVAARFGGAAVAAGGALARSGALSWNAPRRLFFGEGQILIDDAIERRNFVFRQIVLGDGHVRSLNASAFKAACSFSKVRT
jgi:hypothetical protein